MRAMTVRLIILAAFCSSALYYACGGDRQTRQGDEANNDGGGGGNAPTAVPPVDVAGSYLTSCNGSIEVDEAKFDCGFKEKSGTTVTTKLGIKTAVVTFDDGTTETPPGVQETLDSVNGTRATFNVTLAKAATAKKVSFSALQVSGTSAKNVKWDYTVSDTVRNTFK